MDIKNEPTFKRRRIFDLTSTVQNNTLLNRGIIELGGIAIPQAIMANNKAEAGERAAFGVLYFVAAFLTPLFMLPFFNKRALKAKGIVENFSNNEKRIIEVSKEFLVKNASHLEKGIKEFAKKNNIKEDFDNILKRFPDKEILRKKLLKAHENILRNDFLTTALMWCSIPLGVTHLTEKITKRQGFSAAYEMRGDSLDSKKYEKEKRIKTLTSVATAVFSSLVVPKLIMKNMIKEGDNLIKKLAANFNYTNGKYMSKPIFFLMWSTTDFPCSLISSRDKNEMKDRAIRFSIVMAVFFGGDYVLNNILGRLGDKLFKTDIMGGENKENFFKNFARPLKALNQLNDKRSKALGVGIYWSSILINTLLLGFGLPALMNRILRNDVLREKSQIFEKLAPYAKIPKFKD